MKPPVRTRVGKCPVSLITMFFPPNPTNVSNISIFCAVQWFELEPCLIQKHFCPTAGGLRCTNGRALRHPSRDFLVPYVTVNGFGRLINRDEWEPIHNPLCTWPGALSVLQDLKKTALAAETGQLLPPVGRGVSLAAPGNVYFRLQVCTKTELRRWQGGLQGAYGRTGQQPAPVLRENIRYFSALLLLVWKTHEKHSCERRSGGLSPYGNVNNLRLSGVKSYMGMLGMLRAESGATADIMIQKQESFYDVCSGSSSFVSVNVRCYPQRPSPEAPSRDESRHFLVSREVWEEFLRSSHILS